MANSLPRYRDIHWEGARQRVLQALASGEMKLFRANTDIGLRASEHTVSGAGNPRDLLGYNQPSLMIASPGKTVPSPLFNLSGELRADLWSFRDAWFLVRFDVVDKRFHVKELIRPYPGADAPVVATPRCTFQLINDRSAAIAFSAPNRSS